MKTIKKVFLAAICTVAFILNSGCENAPKTKEICCIQVSGDYKNIYYVGEEFDPTGMVVKLHYKDNTFENTEKYTVSGFDSSKPEDGHMVMVSYSTVFTYISVKIISKEHVHIFSEDWTTDAEYHWHEATCGHDVKDSENPHEWNNEEYQYDSKSGKDIRTCTVCEYVDEKEHVHAWELYSTITPATCVTKGERKYKCSGCEENKTDEIPELYSSPLDAGTGNKATSASTYVYFGVFPKTIKASSVTINEAENITMGANKYYKGNDGEWYAKVTAFPYETSYTYSNTATITKGNTDYFKVEPIKWKVLTKDYNGTKKALLLAEETLTANVPYYKYNSENNKRTVGSDTGINPNNYKYSQIRAFLNGLDFYYDTSSTETTKKTDYTDKGFLQTAFTAEAQTLITETTVDNSADSTTDAGNNIPKATSYSCENTTDKIFLLSEKEVTTTAYGFDAYNKRGTGNARIRFPTDYAKANYAWQITISGIGGSWWLRSPSYDDDGGGARNVGNDGDAGAPSNVIIPFYGVVPAFTISLQ